MYGSKITLGFVALALVVLMLEDRAVMGQDATVSSTDTVVEVGVEAVTDAATVGGEAAAVTQAAGTAAGPGETGAPAVEGVTSAADETSDAAAAVPTADGAVVTPPDTEGATIAAESGTVPAGGATEVGADSTTVSDQGAPAEGTATLGEEVTGAPRGEVETTGGTGVAVVTSGGTLEEAETTGVAGVETQAPVTRPPPEVTYTVTSIPVTPYLIVDGTDGGYRGYIIDVLDKLRIIMNVEFKLQIVADGKYGKKNADGTWTGMIGEVIRGEADLAAAPLTVTVDRDEVVDFTHPVFRYSAAVIISQRSPFSSPRLRTLEDLVEAGFNFAVTKNSNIHKSLAVSTKEVDKKVMESITKHNGLKDSDSEGVRRARYDSKYAFLMESGSADWISHQEPCDLAVIPTEIYKRKYAFAIKNLSPLRDTFNRAIVDMQELGIFEGLRDKWFRGGECSGCDIITGSIFNMAALVCLSLIHHWA